MPQFSIAVDLSQLMPSNSPFTADTLPSLAFAVQAILDAAEAQWKTYASGAPLPSGKSIGIRSGQYLRSIGQRRTGPFSGEVYSELPYAIVIEKGSPARDLHDLLRSSLKVRISQRSGKRYLIIPFRHSNNPNNVMRDNAIPQSVQDWWINRIASSISSVGERPVHSDIRGVVHPKHAVYDIKTRALLTTPQRSYSWGDRLVKSDLAALGVSAQQARRLSGLVNFRRPGQSGGASHSKFLTFRTMSEGSPGWRVPEREGFWPARITADKFRPAAEKLFKRAVEDDIRRILPT